MQAIFGQMGVHGTTVTLKNLVRNECNIKSVHHHLCKMVQILDLIILIIYVKIRIIFKGFGGLNVVCLFFYL